MSALISRDPFAREELHRETVQTEETCDWCGCRRSSGRLFAYCVESDSGRRWQTRGLFCSVSCYRAYHEIEG